MERLWEFLTRLLDALRAAAGIPLGMYVEDKRNDAKVNLQGRQNAEAVLAEERRAGRRPVAGAAGRLRKSSYTKT